MMMKSQSDYWEGTRVPKSTCPESQPTAFAPTFDGYRTIPSAEVTATMLDLLQLQPTDKLLEVGTGSGTQTREFSKSGCAIHSIELQPFVTLSAYLGAEVYLHAGDGKLGIASAAPFSAIVATCGVSDIPKTWIEQLQEGGRLVVPLGERDCQRLTLYRKEDGALRPIKVAAYARFSMLEESNGKA